MVRTMAMAASEPAANSSAEAVNAGPRRAASQSRASAMSVPLAAKPSSAKLMIMKAK